MSQPPRQSPGNWIRATGLALACSGSLSAQSGQGWIGLLPSVTPPTRAMHGLSFHPATSRTVLFGGFAPAALADTWLWDGNNWAQLQPGVSPPARAGHAMAHHPQQNRIVLFGGGTSSGGLDFDDTWEFDGAAWLPRQPNARPSARRLAKMAFDPTSGNLLLFGGGVGGITLPVLGDTWEWDGADWTQLQPTTSPPSRVGHAMATDLARGKVVMFGGASGPFFPHLTSTWTWDGTNWHDAAPPLSPTPLTGHAMSYNANNQIVVLKGGGAFNGYTWAWDGTSWHADSRPAQPGGLGHAMAHDVHRDRNVMLGDPQATLNHTWEYSPGTMATWATAGNGCAGLQGVPTLTPIAFGRPVVGRTMHLELAYPVPQALALFVLGFSDSQWQGGTLPQSLSPLGMPGCQLHASPDVTLLVQHWAGTSSLSFHVPWTLSLVGLQVFMQAFISDSGANPTGAIATNSGSAMIGAF